MSAIWLVAMVAAGMGTELGLGSEPSDGRQIGPQTVAPELRLAQANSRNTRLDRAEQRRAQALLTELGYDPGGIDGIWGGRSQQALSDFRRDLGQPIPGPLVAGDIALMEQESARRAAASERARSAPAGQLILYGNRFDLAVLPDGTVAGADWPEIGRRIAPSLPLADRLVLPPEAARDRLTGQREALGRAVRADVETLFALTDAARGPQRAAAGLDDLIADALYAGEGEKLARLPGLDAPGAADLIRRAEASALALAGLDAIAEHLLDAVPVPEASSDQPSGAAQSAATPQPIEITSILPVSAPIESSAPEVLPQPLIDPLQLPYVRHESCAGQAGIALLELAVKTGNIARDRLYTDLCFDPERRSLSARTALPEFGPPEESTGALRYGRQGDPARLALIDHFLPGGDPATTGAKSLTLADASDGGIAIRFGSLGLESFDQRPPEGRYRIAGLAFSEFLYEQKPEDELMIAPFLAGRLTVTPQTISAKLTDDAPEGEGFGTDLTLAIRHADGRLSFDGQMRLSNADGATGGQESFATAEITFAQGRGRAGGASGQVIYLLGTGEVTYTARSGKTYQTWMTLHLYAEREE